MDTAVYFKYQRKQKLAELTAWTEDTDMEGVSVLTADAENGSPKKGDFVARNPEDHNDRWLISADYFRENFDPQPVEAV